MHHVRASRSDVETSSADNPQTSAGGEAVETAAAAGSVETQPAQPSAPALPWLTGPVFLGSKSATRRSEAFFSVLPCAILAQACDVDML